APADAGTTPAAPKSLTEKMREAKAMRAAPTQSPSQGSFVKVGGKNMGPPKPRPDMAPKPDAGVAAGASAVQMEKSQELQGKLQDPAPSSDSGANEPAKPDPGAELKKAFDAKSRELADLKKRIEGLTELRAKDRKAFLAEM